MKASRPLAFVVLAFVIGATISQASFAFADDSSTNPFRAIWQAISELQSKTDSLQAQIDDLRAQRSAVAPEQADTRVSEPSVEIQVSAGEAGQTLVTISAKNAGPENAVGVKLSTYYQMNLFHVNSILGAECTDQARGIIECYLGTIDAGSDAKVVINATPSVIGQQAVVTTDISSITKDANLANNHAEAVFITSETPVVIQPVRPPQVSPQVPAQPQNQTQTQPIENQTSQLPEQNQTQTEVVQQPQNQTQTQPVQQQSQNQTQTQPVEQQPQDQSQTQPPQEQPPAEQSQPPSGEQGSADASSSGSSSSGSSESGTSGGESSPPPPSGSDSGATG